VCDLETSRMGAPYIYIYIYIYDISRLRVKYSLKNKEKIFLRNYRLSLDLNMFIRILNLL